MDSLKIRGFVLITRLVTDGASNKTACCRELSPRMQARIMHTLKLIVKKALDLTLWCPLFGPRQEAGGVFQKQHNCKY